MLHQQKCCSHIYQTMCLNFGLEITVIVFKVEIDCPDRVSYKYVQNTVTQTPRGWREQCSHISKDSLRLRMLFIQQGLRDYLLGGFLPLMVDKVLLLAFRLSYLWLCPSSQLPHTRSWLKMTLSQYLKPLDTVIGLRGGQTEAESFYYMKKPFTHL